VITRDADLPFPQGITVSDISFPGKTVTLKGDRIAEEFQDLVEKYVARSFTRREAQAMAAQAAASA